MRTRLRIWLIMLAAVLAGALMMTGTVGGRFERGLEPLRFAANGHDASGRVVVVELDAASMAAVGRWPWPRRHYARAIDRLRRAGAASIVFDVDLSARSDPQDDAILAGALARSGGLVALPTFSQQAQTGEARLIDSLPAAAFRPHAALASVSIQPDVDGLVRDMPLATTTAATPRPTLSAYIASRSGTADATYPIDFSIRPDSVPRLSFAALASGRFNPALIRDRNVLIGATAIEMGDRYAATYAGVLPGVVIQALAAETLLAGVPVRGGPVAVLMLALVLALPIARARRWVTAVAAFAGATALLAAAVLIAQHRFLVHYPLGIGIGMLTVVLMLSLAQIVSHRFREEQLTDSATALPNERALLERAAAPIGAIGVVQLTNYNGLAAILTPIDLAQAIVRITERLRLASADGVVYRVRSDRLAFALSSEQPEEDLVAGLRAILIEPVEVAGRKIDVAAVIGTATGATIAECFSTAAVAADEATAANEFWHGGITNRDALERSVSLMGELDDAIAAGHVSVHYQPKLHLSTGRVRSAEALVRWHHPTRGFIAPDVFIPLAEQADRIVSLTLYVLQTVLADITRWRREGHDLTAAINISAKLLSNAAFNAQVDRMLDAAAVPPTALIFEVTESAAMSDPDRAIATLNGYRARGIAVSMDDYGTGRSTLTYLRNLPLNELKIDRSFVQHARTRPQDALLVKSTLDLAHQMQLTVVAEGVEDAATLEFLRGLGCDYVQGYHVSRPVPVDTFLASLATWNGEAPKAAAG
ncbi:bifunctional diguanylate cyclase/phosphodiesterase [Sphingomonas sp. TZW2008]|uniref:putative bifunctional diguanylate cyclase/phosphodiesterase n=1 Tax=Sphingomonas sp. TZW2008 TaxID=1917973 RepID=UPI000A2717E4|nr:EAL domain-containing protein [Sphingomonas sp. TZW2008]